jgi:Hypoxia induced protein conserved region
MATTVFFLVSGIKAFQKRDPVRSQRMMRNRIAAQFVTIACFVGYMGLDQFDLRVAPMYQENRKALALQQQQQQQQQQAAAGAAASTMTTTTDKDLSEKK